MGKRTPGPDLANLKMRNTNCNPGLEQICSSEIKSEAAVAICYVAQLRIPIVKFLEHLLIWPISECETQTDIQVNRSFFLPEIKSEAAVAICYQLPN